MGFKMNSAMKSLIAKLTERGISVDMERDNCVTYKHKRIENNAETILAFAIITPYQKVGGVNYYLVRTDTSRLTRMSQTQVIDTIVDLSQKEV